MKKILILISLFIIFTGCKFLTSKDVNEIHFGQGFEIGMMWGYWIAKGHIKNDEWYTKVYLIQCKEYIKFRNENGEFSSLTKFKKMMETEFPNHNEWRQKDFKNKK